MALGPLDSELRSPQSKCSLLPTIWNRKISCDGFCNLQLACLLQSQCCFIRQWSWQKNGLLARKKLTCLPLYSWK